MNDCRGKQSDAEGSLLYLRVLYFFRSSNLVVDSPTLIQEESGTPSRTIVPTLHLLSYLQRENM